MASRTVMAIDIGRKRIRALLGSVNARRGRLLTIRRVFDERIPDSVNSDDAAAVGQWLAEQLKAGKFPRGRAVFAIGREHVGVKRMTLPTSDDAELPDMTRLAMQRELPFDAESALIDFVPVDRTEVSTTVHAVAAPRNVIDFVKAVAESAGIAIERITLRTHGAAALLFTQYQHQLPVPNAQGLPSLGQESQGFGFVSGFAIDFSGDGVEFCLLVGGSICFSRAAEVPQPQDRLAIADAVVTEARRTWMSYRGGDDASDIPVALLLGDQRVSEYASKPLNELLKIPVHALDHHHRVDAGGHDLSRVWPLAGLLIEPVISPAVIDFANPRQAPDVAAKARIRRMLAAAIILLCLGALWTIARRDLQDLRLQAARLNQQQAAEVNEYARYWRDQYKLEHLRQWESIGADWLGHATYLTTIAPPPGKVVLDAWNGTLQSRGVSYDRKTDKWVADAEMTIVLDGEALTRETADAFRESLVQTALYTTNSIGADTPGGKRLPFGFTYRLRTRASSPPPAKPDSEVVKAGSGSESSRRTSDQPTADDATKAKDDGQSTEVASR